ncbi:MAG: thioredoxin [Candidatus Aureabacteria bacterium]|nr:thioredoxin [Candidatus Auribacterota bacterium]
MKKAITLNSKNFQKEVLESEIPVLVDFWGSWCPPCKMVEQTIEELAGDLDGKVKVGKLNVDQYPVLRNQYSIIGLPTFILFKDGQMMKNEVGARSKKQLLKMLNEALGNII